MDMSIFEYQDYKAYLKKWIDLQPNQGRGILSRISEHLNLSGGMISHILNGDKHLSLESGNDLAAFLGLNEEEADYLILLIQYERAGTHSLRERLKRQVLNEQKRASQLGKKMKPTLKLSESLKSEFYSHWLYSGVRNMAACEQFGDVNSIAEHLKIPRSTVQRIVDFLVKNGLCTIKKGQLDVGPTVTHIGSQAPQVQKHHQNWRVHALTKMIDQDERNVFFTSPMSLSKDAAEAIRLKIPSFIEDVRDLVGPSKSEVVRCLNIDWFQY